MSKRKKAESPNGFNIGEMMPVPQNEEQENLLLAIKEHDITFVHGPAGTGKTFIPTMYSICELFQGCVKKIILTRPCIEANGEKLGYLPMGI